MLLGNLNFRLFIDPLLVIGAGIIVLTDSPSYYIPFSTRTASTSILLSTFIFGCHRKPNLLKQALHYQYMVGKMTPEEVLNSITEGINKRDLDSLMTLYEPVACFASQPGVLAESPESIRECLRSFIDLNGKLNIRVKRVLKANDIALVITEWSFNGIGPDGKDVHMATKSADVLRQQSDGTWRFIIDNPWGTD